MNIVLLDALTLGDSDLSVFSALGTFTNYDVTQPNQLLERIAGNDVIITNKVVIDEQVINANPQLKLICIAATGTNNVDLIAAQKAGVMVKNVAGYSTESVAQATLAMLLQLNQHSRYYEQYTLAKQWCASPTFTHIDVGFSELKGKKWGIIGFGAIGQRVAEIAQVFGCELCYYSTSGKNTQQSIEQVDFDTLLSSCDFITIHAPLNEQTQNLINKDALLKLKDGAIILNLGRGGIIDEEAMAEALDEKEIYHGTDVLAIEPMIENHPYLSIKNQTRLVITPHTAWASREARATLIGKIVGNIKSAFSEVKT
ncbi:D-2-hydroxyacid dehydrogenase [Psychromonas sp. Urea-02u-13]|uniref:D-2-hydroxyacid dehydrogenase n=1 Tax=Psychromonas sp. Urea-02u-13 TaxID=2058326 RepID=UPI000C33855C|nr:D-2-hydroxyacid dehydrogenase [Psychromonas sp. Urea-02u-13]PKG38489.1 hydroxyacid dehydrogenase [Psychromonas sp. Urea-02u-13]